MLPPNLPAHPPAHPPTTHSPALYRQAVRVDLKRHYAAAALGVGAFFAEDLVMYSGWGGYVHSGACGCVRVGQWGGVQERFVYCNPRCSMALPTTPKLIFTLLMGETKLVVALRCCLLHHRPSPPAPTLHCPRPLPLLFGNAAWHCLACYGVATLDGLLAHKERQQLQAQLERGGDPATPGLGGAKPLRRPVHSSASSLPSYGQHSYGYRGSKLAGSSPAGSSPAGSSPALLSPPPGWA